MKKDLLLFGALGLIGYGLYKFLSPRSSSTGLGSNFLSSGTARIPTVFGAAKPGTAPVLGGYSSNPPSAGTDIIGLGTAAARAAAAAARKFKEYYDNTFGGGRNDNPIPTPNPPYYNPDLGESAGNTGAARSDSRLYVPTPHSPVPVFSSTGDFSFPAYQGVDDFDTSDVGSIA